jgi:hypothetical protein
MADGCLRFYVSKSTPGDPMCPRSVCVGSFEKHIMEALHGLSRAAATAGQL